MKKFLLTALCSAAVLPFSACEGDGGHRGSVRTTTTTTEESTIQHPLQGSAGTNVIRTY